MDDRLFDLMDILHKVKELILKTERELHPVDFSSIHEEVKLKRLTELDEFKASIEEQIRDLNKETIQ